MSNDQQPQQLTVKETLEQGNRLIAEFLGWHLDPKRSLKYHSSWDWLMPVVEKIADIPMEGFINEETEDGGYAYPITFGMRTEIGEWMVRFRGHGLHQADTLIQAAWLAVVDFIQWRNTQNNK